jgi:hypothetical protein
VRTSFSVDALILCVISYLSSELRSAIQCIGRSLERDRAYLHFSRFPTLI